MSAALDELKSLSSDYITPKQAASVLGGDPQFIRASVKADRDYYGFRAIVHGDTVRLPRVPFIKMFEPDWIPDDQFNRTVEAAVAAVLEKLGVSA